MKLLEHVALVCRRRGLAASTCDAYCSWIKAYLAFCAAARGEWAHPAELGTADAELYLNHLVGERHLSASSQNQALCALVFLYTHVLEDVIPQDHLGKLVLLRSHRPVRVPTVLSVDEVRRVLAALPDEGIPRLMLELMYGTGLRVGECCRLRVRPWLLRLSALGVRRSGDTLNESTQHLRNALRIRPGLAHPLALYQLKQHA